MLGPCIAPYIVLYINPRGWYFLEVFFFGVTPPSFLWVFFFFNTGIISFSGGMIWGCFVSVSWPSSSMCSSSSSSSASSIATGSSPPSLSLFSMLCVVGRSTSSGGGTSARAESPFWTIREKCFPGAPFSFSFLFCVILFSISFLLSFSFLSFALFSTG